MTNGQNFLSGTLTPQWLMHTADAHLEKGDRHGGPLPDIVPTTMHHLRYVSTRTAQIYPKPSAFQGKSDHWMTVVNCMWRYQWELQIWGQCSNNVWKWNSNLITRGCEGLDNRACSFNLKMAYTVIRNNVLSRTCSVFSKVSGKVSKPPMMYPQLICKEWKKASQHYVT